MQCAQSNDKSGYAGFRSEEVTEGVQDEGLDRNPFAHATRISEAGGPGLGEGRPLRAPRAGHSGSAVRLQNDTRVAKSLNILATLQLQQGRFAEAEPFAQRSLNIRLRQSGPDSVDVAQSRNSLAEIYSSEGRLSEAEPLQRQTVATVERQLPDSPVLATILNNLATTLVDEGRYTEAESIFLRMLAQAERGGGKEGLLFARSLRTTWYGFTSTDQKYREAEAMLVRALGIREKLLPADHPDVVGTSIRVTRGHLAVGTAGRGAANLRERMCSGVRPYRRRSRAYNEEAAAIARRGMKIQKFLRNAAGSLSLSMSLSFPGGV